MRHKFAKNCLILTACLSVLGCDESRFQSKQIIKQGSLYSEICIDGVVYLRAYNGNLTPKVNADFYPHTCETQGENNG